MVGGRGSGICSGTVVCCDRYHVRAREEVPIPPDPKGQGKDGDPLTSVEGEVGVVVWDWVGMVVVLLPGYQPREGVRWS